MSKWNEINTLIGSVKKYLRIFICFEGQNKLSDMKLYKLCINHLYFITLPITQHFGMMEMYQTLKNSQNFQNELHLW